MSRSFINPLKFKWYQILVVLIIQLVLTIRQIQFYINRIMFIKNALVSVAKKLVGDKKLGEMTNQFLIQLVFLTTIKNYLNKAAGEQNYFLIPQEVRRHSEKKKLVLVLDMDETLVYTRRPTKPGHTNYVLANSDGQDMYIQPRPFAREFLAAASQIFTVWIYTAGKKQYADTVLDSIDVTGIIQKRFYRDSCKKVSGNIVKDLRYLKRASREKRQMILVDDNQDSIRHNYPFALKIAAFEGNQKDNNLNKIFQTLLKFYY